MELPKFVQIEPVGQCNIRCRMCPVMFRQDATTAPAFLSFEDFTRIVQQFPAMEELHLQGLGEPMMHPQFFDMVAHAVAKGISVSTNSNLTLLSETRAERCVRSGLQTLHISVDSGRPETYEDIRLGSCFERLSKNVRLLCEARQRLNSVLPSLRMVVVIMRRNLDELPDLVRLAARWSMASVFVQHLAQEFDESSLPIAYQPMRGFIKEEALTDADRDRVERAFSAAREMAADVGIELRLPRMHPRIFPPGTPGNVRCDWPWRGAYVSYQGFAMPCCIIATPDRLHMGNVLEQGVESVWNGPRYRQFREQLDSAEPPELCRSCAVYKGIF